MLSRDLGNFLACSVMKRLERRLLGRAPGNSLARSLSLDFTGMLLLGPEVDDSI